MDLDQIQKEFPVVKNRIFFDHAKVAPIPNRLVKTVKGFLENACNYGTAHYGSWMKDVEVVRNNFAKFINADPSEIAFIKNTSEGISIVANGIDWKAGDNVVIPDIEFPANVYPWWNLKRLGVETRMVPSVDGRVPFDNIIAKVDNSTRAISVSSVECNRGFRNDLERIGTFCKEKKIFFCVDSIQSLGVLPMDVKKYNVDFLAADGHKWLLGVEGCGVFYIAKNMLDKIYPTVVGWDSVVDAYDFMNYDFRFRPDAKRFEEGSLNIMSIKALGASLSIFREVGMDQVTKRIMKLGDTILEQLKKRDLKILNSIIPEERSGIISFTGPFDLQNFNTYIQGQNVSITVRDGLVRLSPHFYNTEDESGYFFDLLDFFVKKYS